MMARGIVYPKLSILFQKTTPNTSYSPIYLWITSYSVINSNFGSKFIKQVAIFPLAVLIYFPAKKAIPYQ